MNLSGSTRMYQEPGFTARHQKSLQGKDHPTRNGRWAFLQAL